MLALGSAGYFALNPDVFSSSGVESHVQDGNLWGEGAVRQAAHVEPEAEPVEGSADGNGGATGGSVSKGGFVSGSSDASVGDAVGSDNGSTGGGSDNAGSGSTSAKPGSGGSGSSQQGGGGHSDAPSAEPQDPAPKTVTVSISVDSSAAGAPVSVNGTFTFEEGATVYDALCALGLNVGSRDSIHGVYVSSINGLVEKEHGPSSGWMYAVNGKQPNVACSAYRLGDGDAIQWRYVTG